ncbi:unnamed protein product [Cutaneotrichosporon oleaginosum]
MRDLFAEAYWEMYHAASPEVSSASSSDGEMDGSETDGSCEIAPEKNSQTQVNTVIETREEHFNVQADSNQGEAQGETPAGSAQAESTQVESVQVESAQVESAEAESAPEAEREKRCLSTGEHIRYDRTRRRQIAALGMTSMSEAEKAPPPLPGHRHSFGGTETTRQLPPRRLSADDYGSERMGGVAMQRTTATRGRQRA